MSEIKHWQTELAEYIRQGKPQKSKKSAAWQIVIGL